MRLKATLICTAIVAVATWVLWHRHSTSSTTAVSPTPPPGPYSDLRQVAWLEKLGYVPTNAPLRDHWLASYTSWWGKRLDPKEFWKHRILWCAESALAAAKSHGRGYPPVPQDDPAIPYDNDRRPIPSSPEGYDIPYVSSSRECGFWEGFDHIHPMPPEKIAFYQTSPMRYRRNDALFFGCPPEALSEEAIHWAKVLKWRAEYQADLALPPGEMAKMTNSLLRKGSIDPKLITGPLTDAQLKASKAWKLAYLQRLRKEKADEPYINAYLKAWNLTPAEVFAESTPH